MTPSADADSSPPPSFRDNSENDLQPFCVLHQGSLRPNTKRRIDLSRNASSPAAVASKLNARATQDFDDSHLNSLRFDAFEFIWSKIKLTIEDVLRDFNSSLFNDVNAWVHESFKAFRLSGEPGLIEATRPYPIVTDALSKQLFAGLVYTKNMDFVDDQLTFKELGIHLMSRGCHVANLSSLDFSAKDGIGGCLMHLLRQFLMVTLDAADLSILASWYWGQREYKPVVIIVQDLERCCGSVLSDFILMLSEWMVKIPVILVLGVATTLDAPRNILSSNALQRLCASKFTLGSPAQRMDAIIQAVLLKPCSWFSVGHKVALFMRDYFLKHDGTSTSFVRALKIACMEHFSTEPLSFLLKDLDEVDDLQHLLSENHAFKWDMVLKHSTRLPSCRRIGVATCSKLLHALTELKKLHNCWATVVMCLHEAGKPQNIELLDLYCEVFDPEHAASLHTTSVSQILRKVRDLPPAALSELVERWGTLTADIGEVHKKVKELESMMKLADNKSSACGSTNVSLGHSTKGINASKYWKCLNEKAVMLIRWMLRDQTKPIEGHPFHEIICFKNVEGLQSALLGDPRKTIQTDILEVHKYMGCICCSNRGNKLLPSLHDTSIMYVLAQELGDAINVHNWYQSFKATVIPPPAKGRREPKQLSSPNKRKVVDCSHSYNEAAIQARFCRAVCELQITGLVRMPSKRRPDYVQRVAFGL